MCPPDFLSVDQGSSYVSQYLKRKAAAEGVTIEEASIETPGSIGIAERYHSPLRSSYKKIRETLQREEATNDECLHMATYVAHYTMGPEGLCPMLFVFGSLPRPARTNPAPSQSRRRRTIQESKYAVLLEHANRRLAFALKHTSGPKAKEMSERLRDLPSRSPVLVYRKITKKWDGPFKYVSDDNETAVVQLRRGRKIVRTTCVKTWVRSQLNHPLSQA